jgi:hypothetical protein
MTPTLQQVAREARTMTIVDVLRKADAGEIKWVQAAEILNVSPRHLLRMRKEFIELGIEGLRDRRSGRRMPSRTPSVVVERVCSLKAERYAEYSVKHFHDVLVAKHGFSVSYTTVKKILLSRGLATKAPGRGKYRRLRERRPMRGMLLHIDGSTHEWIKGVPKQDLIVVMDDADGRILYARFVEQEGTMSTLTALEHVLLRHGRFCELYTDRGSHFCRTEKAGEGPADVQNGQVSRVLKVLGITHIRARSPQARGRSERAFRTIQDRLPKELRTAEIDTYAGANRYLDETFVADFNERFTVTPMQRESAFTPLVGLDLKLLLTTQQTRIVRQDNTVSLDRLVLQLPQTRRRPSLARCEVVVHVFTDQTFAVSYLGREIARFDRFGKEVTKPETLRKTANTETLRKTG